MKNPKTRTVFLLLSHMNRVYNDSTMLHVKAKNARLLALENGDLADVTEYAAAYRRAYHGQLLIYVSALDKAEPVSVEITGEGIQTQTIMLSRA